MPDLDWQINFLSKDNVITQNLLIVLMNVAREKGMLGKDSLGKVFPHTLVQSLVFRVKQLLVNPSLLPKIQPIVWALLGFLVG